MIPFSKTDEAFALANDTHFGLNAIVYTESLHLAQRAARELKVGNVWINAFGIPDMTTPWGGRAGSGLGRELGARGHRVVHRGEDRPDDVLTTAVTSAGGGSAGDLSTRLDQHHHPLLAAGVRAADVLLGDPVDDLPRGVALEPLDDAAADDDRPERVVLPASARWPPAGRAGGCGPCGSRAR